MNTFRMISFIASAFPVLVLGYFSMTNVIRAMRSTGSVRAYAWIAAFIELLVAAGIVAFNLAYVFPQITWP